MRVDRGDLTNVVPGFTNIIFGSNNTGLVSILTDGGPANAFDFTALGANIQFIGDNIDVNERIDQGSNEIIFSADTELDLNSALVGDGGDVNILNRTAGGPAELLVNGNLGAPPSGDYHLTIDGQTNGGFDFTGGVGGTLQDIVVTVDTSIVRFNNSSAFNAQGSVDINSDVQLAGGVFAAGGSVNIDGDINLTGLATFRVASGNDLTVTGTTTTANGNNITIRSFDGGPIDTVALGDVMDAGNFRIDSRNAATATNVNLNLVDAERVLIRGVTTTLAGDVTASDSLNQIISTNIIIVADIMVFSSGMANHFVQLVGTIDGTAGTENLTVDSSMGFTSFVGEIGGITALNDLDVTSGRASTISSNITVGGDFSWTTIDSGATNDTLRLLSGRTVNAGGNITIMTDDGFNGDTDDLIAGGICMVDGVPC